MGGRAYPVRHYPIAVRLRDRKGRAILCSHYLLSVGTLLFVSVGLVSPTAFPFRSQKSIGFSTLGVRSVALLQVTKLTSNFLLTQVAFPIPEVY